MSTTATRFDGRHRVPQPWVVYVVDSVEPRVNQIYQQLSLSAHIEVRRVESDSPYA